jgi:16S rRNA (adenine1518-N6/adenine1519-N6)-dimethyltransferase
MVKSRRPKVSLYGTCAVGQFKEQSLKHKPKLGQNFLADPAACAAIADALGDVSGATVVEIGPGRGAITEILARRAKRLVAIELDRELAPRLRVQFSGNPSVEVIEADVLAVDLAALRQGEERLAVVGNLPYYITSDILLRLFEFHAAISCAVVMVQREVADRVAATPGTRDYGLLSATAQLYARVEKVLTLPPSAFRPAPEVHSTVLRLTMRPRFAELGIGPEPFIGFLKAGFAQKRKTLAKNLRAAGFDADRVGAAMEAAGIPPLARGEEIELERMAELWRGLKER